MIMIMIMIMIMVMHAKKYSVQYQRCFSADGGSRDVCLSGCDRVCTRVWGATNEHAYTTLEEDGRLTVHSVSSPAV